MTPPKEFSASEPAKTATVLCIAGFDPCGGAGLLADARAISAFGAYAVCAQTALVPQNTVAVRALVATSPATLRLQLETLAGDIAFGAIKIGLLPDVAAIEVVAEFVARCAVPIVVDPVLAPTRGQSWSDGATRAALVERVFPLATLVTPNLPEAQVLGACAVGDAQAMETAALQLRARWGADVLLKGGHLENTPTVDDVYGAASGATWLHAPRVAGDGVRGTGCLLSSAIAAQLAQGVAPLEAAQKAKVWMTARWREAQAIGQGRRVAIF